MRGLTDTPLRVLHVTAPALMGGLETVVLQLAAGMRQRGHDVQVAAVLTPGSASGHPFVTALENRGVPVHPLELGSRAYLAERRAIAALARRLQPVAIHTHGYRADVLHGPLARALGVAHVMTLHGFVGGNWRDRLYESLQVRAARRADVVVAVSQPIVDRLQHAGAARNVQLLRNGMAPAHEALSRDAARAMLGIPADVPAIGWIGRVSHEKGPDQFVEALAKAPTSIMGVLLGDGPERANVLAQAEKLGVSSRLLSPGAIADARRYLAALDALALTSRTEGTPMVLLEAMSASVPVVTTMVGGVPDVVSEAEALCCAPGDVSALAVAFGQIVSQADAARDRAMRAFGLVERTFGIESWLDGYERIYASAAGKTRPSW